MNRYNLTYSEMIALARRNTDAYAKGDRRNLPNFKKGDIVAMVIYESFVDVVVLEYSTNKNWLKVFSPETQEVFESQKTSCLTEEQLREERERL